MAYVIKEGVAYIAHLRSLPYDEYLQSVWWRRRRYEAFMDADWRCKRCGRPGMNDPYGHYGLEVHHHPWGYKNKGCETDEDIIVVCRDCHRTEHVRLMVERLGKINVDAILGRL